MSTFPTGVFSTEADPQTMRAKDADLSTLWQGVCVRYEQQGRRVPPLHWRAFYAVVHWILERGQW